MHLEFVNSVPAETAALLTALQDLEQLGPESEAALPFILRCLNDGQEAVRRQAWRTLEAACPAIEARNPSQVTALVTALEDEEAPQARLAAIVGFCRMVPELGAAIFLAFRKKAMEGQDVPRAARAPSGGTPEQPEATPATEARWQPPLDPYRNQSAITFSSKEGLRKALHLFWNDEFFERGVPRYHLGDWTIVVPTEVIQHLRERGLEFEVREVLSPAQVPATRLADLRARNQRFFGMPF